MELLSLSLAIIAVYIIGYNILYLLSFKSKSPSHLVERLCISYGLGFGFISMEMFLFYFLRIEFSILRIIAPWTILFALNLYLRIRYGTSTINSVSAEKRENKQKALDIFLKCGISIEVLYAFFRALIKPIDSYDAIAIYAIKAKIFYLARSIPADYFGRLANLFPHPDYPLNIPLSEVFCYLSIGNLNDQLVKVIFPLFFLSILGILYFAIRQFASRSYALIFTFILATIPHFNEFAMNGYVDLPLAYYYFTSTVSLLMWFRSRDMKYLLISAVMVALAGWTKNEGLMLCAINIILTVIFTIRDRERRISRIIIYAGLIAVILSPFLWLRFSAGLVTSDIGFSEAGPLSLSRISDRILPMLYIFQKQFFGIKQWNIFWMLISLIIALNYKRVFTGARKYLTLSLILAVSGYILIYLTSHLGIEFIVSKTWNRFLIHLAPIALYLVAIILKEEADIYDAGNYG